MEDLWYISVRCVRNFLTFPQLIWSSWFLRSPATLKMEVVNWRNWGFQSVSKQDQVMINLSDSAVARTDFLSIWPSINTEKDTKNITWRVTNLLKSWQKRGLNLGNILRNWRQTNPNTTRSYFSQYLSWFCQVFFLNTTHKKGSPRSIHVPFENWKGWKKKRTSFYFGS